MIWLYRTRNFFMGGGGQGVVWGFLLGGFVVSMSKYGSKYRGIWCGNITCIKTIWVPACVCVNGSEYRLHRDLGKILRWNQTCYWNTFCITLMCMCDAWYLWIITGQNQTIMGSKKNLFIGKKKCSLHLLIM